MTTKLFTKPQTQQVIKDLRSAGYEVTKDKFGKYDCQTDSGKKLFVAMPGSRGYLVRYDSQLLQEA